MFIAILLIAIIFVFYLFLKSPESKGSDGEAYVDRMFFNNLPEQDYKILSNITLPTYNGSTTQIDHIIFSIYGIFVIETKNYSGWIFGTANQKTWTQTFRNGEKYHFQNPLFQNQKHIRTIATLLRFPDSAFYSIIAFVGDAEIKTEMPNNVLQDGNELINFIKFNRNVILTEEKITNAYNTILSKMLVQNEETKNIHIQNVNKIKEEKHYTNNTNSLLKVYKKWKKIKRFLH
jgi:hypothetical protein